LLQAKIDGSVATGTPLVNYLSISSNPTDLSRADEAPDTEQATLTVGNRRLYMPMIIK
jgi:hypothetical protein